MARLRLRRGFSIQKVVKQLSTALITLYVGGTILIELGTVMNCTQAPFYRGLTLIGWTVENSIVPYTSGTCNTTGVYAGSTATYNSMITSVSGTGGILVVVGIVAIASVILQFVDVSF